MHLPDPSENLTGLRHSRNVHLLRKLKPHYCFHVNPNFCHILGRMNPLMHSSTHAPANTPHAHTYTRLWKFHCNIPIIFRPKSAHFFLLSSYSEYKFIHRLRIPPVRATLLSPYLSLYIITLIFDRMFLCITELWVFPFPLLTPSASLLISR